MLVFTVSVALGNGSKDQQMAHLSQMLQFAAQAMQGGLPIVTTQNMYNLGAALIKAMGYQNVDDFLTQPPPPQPDRRRFLPLPLVTSPPFTQPSISLDFADMAKKRALRRGANRNRSHERAHRASAPSATNNKGSSATRTKATDLKYNPKHWEGGGGSSVPARKHSD